MLKSRWIIAASAASLVFAVTACESRPTSPEELEERTEAVEPEIEKNEMAKSPTEAIAAANQEILGETPEQRAERVEATVDSLQGKPAAVNEPAPDFTLSDQDGEEVRLSDLKGKTVVLEWTEKGCPFVKRHYKARTMKDTHERSGGAEKVVWLAVNSSHFVTPEETITWRTENEIDYPVLLDADGKVGQLYGAKTTPHMYVIDKEGVLRYSGAIDDNEREDKSADEVNNYVSQAIEAIEAGKPVEQAETKPYGCAVKYKS